MIERLRRRAAEAERRWDRAEGALPAAVIDGDERERKRLRREADEAARDSMELQDAIDLAAERERRAQEEEESNRRRTHADRARALAGRRAEAAAAVDAAFAALEAASVEHARLDKELALELGRAGMSDGGRIARKAGQNMRWAAWALAPTAAGLLEVPFANAGRRAPLAELDRASVPDIQGERADG